MTVDTTVQPKAITFPTDAKLLLNLWPINAAYDGKHAAMMASRYS